MSSKRWCFKGTKIHQHQSRSLEAGVRTAVNLQQMGEAAQGIRAIGEIKVITSELQWLGQPKTSFGNLSAYSFHSQLTALGSQSFVMAEENTPKEKEDNGSRGGGSQAAVSLMSKLWHQDFFYRPLLLIGAELILTRNFLGSDHACCNIKVILYCSCHLDKFDSIAASQFNITLHYVTLQ